MIKMAMIPILKFISVLLFLFLFSCNNEKKHILYHPNGLLKLSGNYQQGKAHGYWQGFYENGILKSSGLYYKGNLSGRWIWYYQDGSVLKDTIYTSNFING